MALWSNATSSTQLLAKYFAVAVAARPGKGSGSRVAAATWINEDFPSCRRTNSLQRAEQAAKPTTCSSHPGLPTVNPSRWVQLMGSALFQIHPSIFCSPFTALGTLGAAQSRERFVGSVEILGARDPGCEYQLQRPGFTVL